jgi:hypothetical protein
MSENPLPANSLPVDYLWFASRFENLLDRLESLESAVTAVEDAVSSSRATAPQEPRDYYSTQEFGDLVGRSEYTVREWCRLMRINAEKADSGRGDAKSWKIHVAELQRYRDHGLLPMAYLR